MAYRIWSHNCIACGLSLSSSIQKKAMLTKLGCLSGSRFDVKKESTIETSRICSRCATFLPIHYPISWQEYSDISLEVLSCFYYKKPINHLLLQLKFQQKPYISESLAQLCYLLLQRILGEMKGKYILVPVPISRERMKERGYNQAALIAERLGELAEIPCVTDLLERIKNTRRQTEMKSRLERLSNVKDAFRIRDEVYSEYGSAFFYSKEIILFDDVLTTGMTIESAAQPLNALGLSVKALTIASEKHNFR